MAASPSSSPRLPSPPPMAEDQLGPKSPTPGGSSEDGKLGANIFQDGASRRIRPGTKAADMPEGPPLLPLTDVDSAFQLTEHLKALYNAAIHPEGSSTIVPMDRATATRLAQPPDGVDKYLWLYELCRFLCQEVNKMIVALFSGDPPCSAQTCNEMRASEWQYLCAVHDPPKACCAIDYCCHTLDWAANVLTSPKNFPSRLALATETGSGHQQLRQLTNIFRRVYRIFAHAWFQHRDMFWKVESKSGIYIFFKTVCDVYGLIPEDNYTVPPEAEGIDTTPMVTRQPIVLKRSEEEPKKADSQELQPNAAASITTATGHTTKRHRQTPSVDAGSITTVPEETEETEEDAEKHPKRQDTVIIPKNKIEEMILDGENKKESTPGETESEHKPEVEPTHEKAEPEVKLNHEVPPKHEMEPQHEVEPKHEIEPQQEVESKHEVETKHEIEPQQGVESKHEVETKHEIEPKNEAESIHEGTELEHKKAESEKEAPTETDRTIDPSAGEPVGSTAATTETSILDHPSQVLTPESQNTSAAKDDPESGSHMKAHQSEIQLPEVEEDKMPVETKVVGLETSVAKEEDQKIEEPIIPKVEKPAEAVEEPTKAVEEPAKVVEEPAKAVEEPAKAVEKPVKGVEAPESTKITDSSSKITPAASTTPNEPTEAVTKDEEEATKSVED